MSTIPSLEENAVLRINNMVVEVTFSFYSLFPIKNIGIKNKGIVCSCQIRIAFEKGFSQSLRGPGMLPPALDEHQ